ncbi:MULTISPECIES: DUF3954 domain-containing protein [Pontibacillus]|uniref:DUF3954 domain-containing protein n=1 Tax=Pontibacillus chungwhensis TaxID=265426 RepID=A0ABY8UZ11_9BACI|nr:MULTISPECIES: DUF3954 domain-containing protein [Pontibacillus]MCD5324759.1 DUF3954 domain-containing protein [Pontibacillus sp. HN14]WIF98719.1 DUF3954 domain-containing protein [Pontibacillus chungwhensis]
MGQIKMETTIDLSENAMYVVRDGQITKVSAKPFGSDEVVWKDGKVVDVVRTQRQRLNGQEVI